jgi:hypothetical protein
MRLSVIAGMALLSLTPACGTPSTPVVPKEPASVPLLDGAASGAPLMADAGGDHGDAGASGSGPRFGAVHSCTLGAGPLPGAAKASVERAIAAERQAELVYEAARAELGDAPPLRHIARAERRHSAALEALLTAHGHALPVPDKKAVKGPSDLPTACRGGVAAEKDLIALYDKELAGALPSDVQCVFEHLQHASRDHHLPAFERCSSPPK